MKTTLRAVALCLLLSNARGFANSWADFANTAAQNALPTLAAIWVACRVLDVAHVVADKTAANINQTLGNTLGKIADLADPRVTLQQVCGCDDSSK
jgi:hypothetical protein